MADDELVIPVRFDNTAGIADLDATKMAARAAGEEIRASAESAGGGVSGLREKINALAMEHSHAHREGRILASMLGGVLPAGAQQLGAALSAFAVGGGIGVGIEALKLGFEKLHEEVVRGREIVKEREKAELEVIKSVGQAWDAYFKTLDKKEEDHSAVVARENDKRLTEERTELHFREGDAEKAYLRALAIEVNLTHLTGNELVDRAAAFAYHKTVVEGLEENYDKLRMARATIDVIRTKNAETQKTAHVQEEEIKRTAILKKNETDAERIIRESARVGVNERTKALLDYEERLKASHGNQRAILAAQFAYERQLSDIEKKEAAADYRDNEEEYAAWQKKMTKAHELEAKLRKETTKEEITFEKELARIGEGLVRDLTSQLGQYLRASKALEAANLSAGKTAQASAAEQSAAIAKWVQDALAGIATMAAQRAIFAMAEFIASDGTDQPKLAAALMFAGIAATAGVGAYAIGQTRGLTQDEGASVGQGTMAGLGGNSATSGGARSVAGGGGSAGGVTVRETVYVLVDPFEGQADAAARAARTIRLAKRLDHRF